VTFSADQALFISFCIFALGQFIQSVEWLRTPELWSSSGAFRRGLGTKSFQLVLVFRILIAFSVIFLWQNPLSTNTIPLTLLMTALWLCQWAIYFKFQGGPSGGSDSMQNLLLSAFLVEQLNQSLWGGNKMVTLGCVYFIGLQSLISYFVAGLSKWKKSEWRSGQALRAFLQITIYKTPKWMNSLCKKDVFVCGLSWILMLFEVGFPIVIFSRPELAERFLILGLLFHLANAYWLGINRFLYAWVATYPCVLFMVKNLH
jgi:hypothetical protein